MIILIPKDGYTIDEVLSYIYEVAKNFWIQNGYVVDENGVVGKTQGINNFSSQRTTTWDTIKTAPDATKYIFSPSNESKYINWKQAYNAMGFPEAFDEIEMPLEWLQEEGQPDE